MSDKYFVVCETRYLIEECRVINKFRYYSGVRELQDSYEALLLGAKLCEYKILYKFIFDRTRIAFYDKDMEIKFALIINLTYNKEHDHQEVTDIVARKFGEEGLYIEVNHDKEQPIEWLKGLL